MRRAAGAGLFKSEDAGAHWRPANNGFREGTIRALAIDPATPTTLYAGLDSDHGSLFRSTDGGQSWARPGGIGGHVRTLAIDPLTPTTLLAGTTNNVPVGSAFKSTSGAASWTRLSTLPSCHEVRDLAIDPQTPTTIYAATAGRGVLKTTDGGVVWSAVNIGLADQPEVSASVLAIDPVHPETVYAGNTAGVFKSTNGAASWSYVSRGALAGVRALVVDPLDPAIVYVGGSSGVHKSTDGGTSWRPINAGLTNPDVSDLAIDPAQPTTLYAATAEGAFVLDQSAEPRAEEDGPGR